MFLSVGAPTSTPSKGSLTHNQDQRDLLDAETAAGDVQRAYAGGIRKRGGPEYDGSVG
jgi:hypothetical protein